MLVIDSDGNYPYVPNTKTPMKSSHPVWQARIDIALGQNTWLYAPDSGHDLADYSPKKETPAVVNQFQKDVSFYLKKYGPQVFGILLARGALTLGLAIDKGALNSTLSGANGG